MQFQVVSDQTVNFQNVYDAYLSLSYFVKLIVSTCKMLVVIHERFVRNLLIQDIVIKRSFLDVHHALNFAFILGRREGIIYIHKKLHSIYRVEGNKMNNASNFT